MSDGGTGARRPPGSAKLTAMPTLAPPAARRARPGREPRDRPVLTPFTRAGGDYGPDGKPRPEALRRAGLPPEGAAMSGDEFDRFHPEFGVELVGGRLSYLPMPFDLHAAIVHFLTRAFDGHLLATYPDAALRGSKMRVLIPEESRHDRDRREPDLVLLLDKHDSRRGPEFWTGADLCVEVVSPDDPNRDYEDKRPEYAAAGVREFWIVDPRERTPADNRGRTVRVLTLVGGDYREAAYEDGDAAPSVLLPGFAVDVTECLAGA